MDPLESTMNIRATRTDLNQSSQQTSQVSSNNRTSATAERAQVRAASDTVTLTAIATDMLKLQESLANMPDIDNERVTSIKNSLAEGSYQINAEKIVQNLLSIEQDLY